MHIYYTSMECIHVCTVAVLYTLQFKATSPSFPPSVPPSLPPPPPPPPPPQILGQVGRVTKISFHTRVKVVVNGREWIMSPLCFHLIDDESVSCEDEVIHLGMVACNSLVLFLLVVLFRYHIMKNCTYV